MTGGRTKVLTRHVVALLLWITHYVRNGACLKCLNFRGRSIVERYERVRRGILCVCGSVKDDETAPPDITALWETVEFWLDKVSRFQFLSPFRLNLCSTRRDDVNSMGR